MDLKLIIVMLLMFISLAMLIGSITILQRNKKNRVSKDIELSSKKNAKNNLYFLYRIYLVTPIIKRYFQKVKNRYRAIYPADEVTLNAMTTKRMTICLGICIAIMTVLCIVCSGDLPYVFVGLCACYIIFTNMINSSEESMQYKLLEQLDTFITDVHSYYHDTKMVDEAISSTLDDLPHEISLHANKIYNIITSTDVEAEVEKYVEVAPNKFLLLMAAICASIMEYGDREMEDGKSIFLKNLNYLKSELNEERLRLRRKKTAFQGKVFSVLIPLFILKPAETILMFNMPDLKNFYAGSGGIISLAIITAITFFSYEAINILKDEHSDEGKDDRLFKAISEIPVVKKILTLQINHNYSKSRRVSDSLKAVGDKNGINVFIVKKIFLALLVFVVVNTVSVSAMERTKDYIMHDFSEAYSDALVPNEEYREIMREVSLELTGSVRKPETTTEAMINYAKSRNLDDTMAEMVVTEMLARQKQFASQYYKWWMFLLSIIAAIIAYNVPYALLKFKQNIMGMNREDEVGQFRTLILILMHEDGMTLDTILEWMERFAHAFKSSISDCIINLEYSQRTAIEKMRAEESGFAPFRRLCDSLLAVDKVGLEGAFDDLETEHDYHQKKREQDNTAHINRCAKRASRIQRLPVWAAIILYVVIPFGSLVLNMFMNFGI